MARIKEPFTVIRRTDSKSYRLTINPSCGLPQRVCDRWIRRSFQNLPAGLADHRNPKSKPAAKEAARTLIDYLKKVQEEEGSAQTVKFEDITVGAWVEKFTKLETSPQAGRNASKNRPYSIGTLMNYRDYYECHVMNDSFAAMKMAEIEEEDALLFGTRMSIKKLKNGRLMGGTRTYKGVLGFVRMAFNNYQKKNRKWINPFAHIDPPVHESEQRDALSEDEVVRLFEPGVLESTLELAICAAMFLSGLRRAEIFVLKPEDLDWKTPKITVRRAWQKFESRSRVMGPPKGKKERKAPFSPILQEAIKKLWEENGQHEYVMSKKDGETPKGSWIKLRLNRWINRSGIELGGRKIVPHCSRHSLASILEVRNVPLRYIQELLGHKDLKTTIGYLPSTEETFRAVGERISEAMEKPETKIYEDYVI